MTNSRGNVDLAEAMREAARPGEIAAPAKLAALVGKLEQPLHVLQDLDQSRDLFISFDEDFGFIRFSFTDRGPAANAGIQTVDRPRYAALLRWLIRELREWRLADDARFARLVAVFVAAQICDLGKGLWALLPDDIGGNRDLADYLKRLVASFDTAFSAAGGRAPPIWESEIVEAFTRADAEGDWATIIGIWRRLPLMFPNTLQTETVRFLYRYDFDGLVKSLANVHKTPVAMQAARILTAGERLRLALAGENPYIQFASAYCSLTDERGSQQRLSEDDRSLFGKLLLKVANDPARWSAWMKVLIRYPAVQELVGRALAHVPDAALDGYVSSIWLYPKQPAPDAGRQSVAECLRAFSEEASPERRAALWTLAHKRWIAWDFNTADPNQHLMAINWSDLDYAIVAYASECMDGTARNDAMLAICRDLETLEHRWHKSLTDIMTCWYRLLSPGRARLVSAEAWPAAEFTLNTKRNRRGLRAVGSLTFIAQNRRNAGVKSRPSNAPKSLSG